MAAGKSIVYALWSVLTMGAGLVCLGLFRDTRRFRQWRRIRAEQEGEIVLGDRALRVGQAVQISTGDDKRFATICALDKRILRLRLEHQPSRCKNCCRPRAGCHRHADRHRRRRTLPLRGQSAGRGSLRGGAGRMSSCRSASRLASAYSATQPCPRPNPAPRHL